MKRQIVTAGFLAACCSTVLAQSRIVIYGVADAGLVLERGGPAGGVTAVGSGVASGNRIGLKGSEDLGGGTSAMFLLENGYNIDTGTAGQDGRLFGRQAMVGLSGPAGIVSFGRQYSPFYKAIRDVADPFGVGLAGNALNVMTGESRIDNMVEYQSPAYRGWSADLAYGAGEVAGSSAANRTLAAGLAYTQGRLNARLVRQRQENATASDHLGTTLAVLSVDFGFAAPSVAYARNHGLAGADSTDILLGLSVPRGPHTILASVIVHRDGTPAARHAQQWAVGYLYGLSKRTDLYAAYGHIRNENGADFHVGNGTDTGSGDTAFNLGIRHTF